MKRSFILLSFLLYAGLLLNAEIKLPGIISSNMVLQQNSNVKLWGSADSDKKIKVKVSWSGKTYSTKSDANGNWILSVNTPSAGGPYSITFSDGKDKTIDNILIGEVWLCSGQSNMAMPMKGFSGQPVFGARDIIAKADKSIPLRFITIEKSNSLQPVDNIISVWRENTSTSVKDFSAVAYFYAAYLQSVLKVPVGIISSSWGGSSLQAWMDSTTLSLFMAVNLSKENNTKPAFQRECQLYNGMIYPLRNFTIKGVLWYQGESNIGQYEFYKKAFPAMVAGWRKLWNMNEFPFYYAQIAPWSYSELSQTVGARFREIQNSFLSEINNTGMVVTIDTGDSLVIHPSMKKEVGERFAFWALANAYNKSGIDYRAPEFNSMKISNDTIVVDFNYAQEGLNCPFNTISGFEIAGADSIFKPANVLLINRGNKVQLTEKSIKNPIAVRYAFRNYSKASLFSNLGLPLTPFRSDNWDDKSNLK